MTFKSTAITLAIGLLLGAGAFYGLTRPGIDITGVDAALKQEKAIRVEKERELATQKEATAQAEIAAKKADADVIAERARRDIVLANTQRNIDRIDETLRKNDEAFEKERESIGADVDPCIRVREQCERAKRELKGIRFPPGACECESAPAGK